MTRGPWLAGLVALALACSSCAPRQLRPRLDPITATERECEQGEELDQCVELGLMYEDGARFEPDKDAAARPRKRRRRPPPKPRVLVADRARARALFERACSGGEGLGCFHLGRLAADATSADAQYVRGCQLKDLASCTAHALALEHGLGIAADREAGRALMRKTCSDGHPRACVNVGVVEYNENVDTAHRREGQHLIERGCYGGDALGCHYLAQIELPAATTRWELLRLRDKEEEACEHGVAAACAAAGAMFRDGVTTLELPQRGHEYERERAFEDEDSDRSGLDAERAVELFQHGCALGDPDACQGVFLALVDGDGIAQDVGKATRMAEEQCTAGHLPSCQSLGYFYELGLGVERDVERAESLYRRVCDVGDAAAAGACSNLAELFADRRELEQAVVLARRGCELGDARGCNAGGVFIVTGAWPGDRAEGLAMLQRACDLARSTVDIEEFCAAAARYH